MYNKPNILIDMSDGEVVATSLHNLINGLNLNYRERDLFHQIVSILSNFDRANNIFQLLY